MTLLDKYWQLVLLAFVCKVYVAECVSDARPGEFPYVDARRGIGGRDARPGEFPYVVQTLKRETLTHSGKVVRTKYSTPGCTGAAIASRWTLTARHCCPTRFQIMGKETLVKHNGTEVISKIESVVSYGSPEKKPSEDDKTSNIIDCFPVPYRPGRKKEPNIAPQIILQDIALFKTEPVILEQYAKVSSVDYTSLYGREVTLLGYGTMTKPKKTESVFDNMPFNKGKPLQIIDKALLIRCDKKNKKLPDGFPHIVYPQVCLVQRCNSGLESLSHGDSGGPVVHSSGVVAVNVGNTDLLFLRASASFRRFARPGIGCVTPVSPYVDWIMKTINSENDK